MFLNILYMFGKLAIFMISLKKNTNPFNQYRKVANHMSDKRLTNARDIQLNKDDENNDINVRLVKVALRFNQTPDSH